MAVNGVEIRVGQVWRTRGGTEVMVVRDTGDATYPFETSGITGIATVTNFGRQWNLELDGHSDLIGLVTDAPVVQPPIPTPEVVSETPLERRAQQSALDVQVGGDHYKTLAIQPVEYCHRNGLGFCESSVIKYVTRWKSKNGIKDLEKARHFIDLLIEMEGGTK